MLLGTILLWALNATVTRYVVTHGFQPLAYATIRYGCATILFWGFTYARERSFRIAMRDMRLVLLAAGFIFINQVFFVYAVDKTSAATVTLFLGMTPIFIGILASVIGLERMGKAFWMAAVVSLIGVGFVASGSGGFSGKVLGDGLAIMTALTWAGYSILITPLMRRYSPFRISSLVLLIGWIPLALAGLRQTTSQSFHFGYAHVDLLRIRGARAVVPDEHPVVHRDQPRRPVARIALLEHAAASRRALRAPPARRAPDAVGGGRRRGDPQRGGRRTVAAPGA